MHIEAGTVLKIGDQTITVGVIKRIAHSHGFILVTLNSSTGEEWMLTFGEATASACGGYVLHGLACKPCSLRRL